MSSIHNIAFSSEKVVSSESGEKYAQIEHLLQVKQSKTALNKYVSGFWCERTTRDGLFHWRKCYYGLWTYILIIFLNQWFKVKRLNNGFISYKQAAFHFHLIDSSCRLLVDYCNVFISCLDSFWRHPFTAEDPLVSKWWNATFLQIYSDEENKLIYILDGLKESKLSKFCNFLGELFL